MGIKVKTKVNFNEIIEKLHKVAKDFAEKKSNGKVDLENIAFDDQKGKFLGGGEFAIFMKQKEGVVSENDKGKFLDIIKEYVHYFVGEEETKYVNEDSLQPIFEDSTADSEETEKIKKEREEREKEEQENKEKQKNNLTKPPGTPLNESIFIRNNDRKLMNLLFEADENTEANEKTDNEQDQKANCIGYGVAYSIDVNGNTDWTITKAINNKMKGFFGGIAADLLNIKIKVGGETVNIGRILDPKKWLEKFGRKDIDASQVAEDVKKAFNNDFKHNKVDVSVEDTKWIESVASRHLKNSPEIREKLKNDEGFVQKILNPLKRAKYAIFIQVKEDDTWYPKYNTKTIATTASKAFGTTYNAGFDFNAVSKDDVIKIDNATTLKLPKVEKSEDEKLIGKFKQFLKQDEEDSKNKKSSGTKNNQIKESDDESNPSETDNGEDDANNEENIGDIITKKLYDKSKNAFGDRYEKSGYLRTDEFLQQNFIKELDEDFKKEITTRYDNVLFIITNGNNSVQNNESFVYSMENKLLEMLFEENSQKNEKDSDKVKKIITETFVETGTELNIDYKDAKRFKIWEKEIGGIVNKGKKHSRVEDEKLNKVCEIIKNNLEDIRKNWDSLKRKMYNNPETGKLYVWADTEKNPETGEYIVKKDKHKGFPEFENTLLDKNLTPEQVVKKIKSISSNENFKNDIIYDFKYEPVTSTQTEKNEKRDKLYVVGSIFKEDKENKNDKDKSTKENGKERVDWYIIPHSKIKDKGDRNMQRSTDSNGVTTTSTSDKEYKPKGK